jgi:hypothetical protein
LIYSILFALLTPVVCLGLGYASGRGIAFIESYYDTKSTWINLPDPPAEPIEIIEVGPGYIEVRAADENIYIYQHPDRDRSWILCDEGYDDCEDPIEYLDSYCPDDAFPPLPKEVMQVADFCIQHEYHDFSRFALLENGSIKLYRIMTKHAYDQFFLAFLFIYGGAFIGFLSGIIIVIKTLRQN